MAELNPGKLFSLREKVALVTGGSRGIGRGMAEGLAAAGADVAVAGRDLDACRRAADAIRKSHGVRTAAFGADVADADLVERMMEGVLEAFGRVDVLVNNAGVFAKTPLLGAPADEWLRVVDVNLLGVYRCCRAVASRMIERKEGGRIINVTSLNAFRGGADISAYCASKGGAQSLTQALAVELAPHKITVNAIAPGLTDTDIHRHWMADPEARERARDAIPLNEIMRPEELAGVAIFLASDASRMITGQTIVVDGGWTVPL